jgi:uncharacterized membrane protein YbhN (UPF0104 family)
MNPSRRLFLAATALTAALAAVAFVPQLLGSEVQRALTGLTGARPVWLWAAGACFVGSLGASAAAYRSAFGLVGARVAPLDAAARYGVGSLVNSFAPARLGDCVRLALFARAIDSDERLWRTGGVFAAIGAGRASVLAALVVCGSLAGALPLWPVLVCVGLVALAGAVAYATRNRPAHSHVAHLLDAFRALGRQPGRGARIAGWIAVATLFRLGAAASIAASLGVRGPLVAAVMIVPALDLAGTMPLTPGNIGLTSGAVAMALRAHGVSMTTALTTGIAFHAVETAAGVTAGIASALFLAELAPTRRWTVAAAAAVVCLAVVGAFSATILLNVL